VEAKFSILNSPVVLMELALAFDQSGYWKISHPSSMLAKSADFYLRSSERQRATD
jgi:hypothetical protein